MSTQFLRKYIDMINEVHISDHNQISKFQANYTDHGYGDKECHKCKHYQAPYSCEIVEGRISPEGWCKYFESIVLGEKWDEPTVVSPKEKGKYHGKTKAELMHAYNALKKSGPHHEGSKEFGKMRELAFAIRAKSNWGKVNK